MISNILLAVFTIAIIANAFALYRHYQALRAFKIVLANLAETQKQFNEIFGKKP
jgi:hypothetical protein